MLAEVYCACCRIIILMPLKYAHFQNSTCKTKKFKKKTIQQFSSFMHLQVCFLTRKKIWKDQSQYAERVKLKETEKMLVKCLKKRSEAKGMWRRKDEREKTRKKKDSPGCALAQQQLSLDLCHSPQRHNRAQ